MLEKQPLALKSELQYQRRYIGDMVKATEKQPGINAIYTQWLQFINRTIEICEKRNRY